MKMLINSMLFCFWMFPVYVFTQRGDTLMNSSSYHEAGFAGQGLKIAIIDRGFDSLAKVQDSMFFPHPDSLICYPNPCNSLTSGGTHGTTCVEVIYDHAPKARYYILDRTQSDPAQFNDFVSYCIAQAVDVISISIIDLRDSWNDGSGVIGQALKSATDAGIMVFIAAGNFATVHWQGQFKDSDMNNVHEWDTTFIDESNNFSIDSAGRVEGYLIWDEPPGAINNWYDLQLVWDRPHPLPDTVIASGDNTAGKFERLNFSNNSSFQNPPVPIDVYFKVQKNLPGSSPPELELYEFHRDGISSFQFTDTHSSIGGTSSSQEPNCLAVAAVPWNRYDIDPAINPDVVWGPSSRGPTNDGNLGPDIASMNGSYVNAYNGRFWGTSCATPNAAGATAAFWSSQPKYSADGVRQVILRKAELFKDWGDPGPDPTYGYGGLYLYNYYPKTEYVFFDGDNSGASFEKPWLNLQQIETHASANSRVVILGGSQNIASPIVLNKPMLYVSLKESSVIK